MGNITFFVIFAVLDVSLDVNLCINCSFFTFIGVKIRRFKNMGLKTREEKALEYFRYIMFWSVRHDEITLCVTL